jgi:hypothetical protein
MSQHRHRLPDVAAKRDFHRANLPSSEDRRHASLLHTIKKTGEGKLFSR